MAYYPGSALILFGIRMIIIGSPINVSSCAFLVVFMKREGVRMLNNV